MIKLDGTKTEILAALNEYGPGEIEKGRFSTLYSHGDEEHELPLPEGWEGYLDAHPEGSDRGGYLPTVHGPGGSFMFSEHDGEWFPYE